MSQREEIEKLLSAEKVDLLRVREECRRGLPNAEIRARVWPLVLGLDKTQLEKDAAEYRRFIQVHNEGIRIGQEWFAENGRFLASRREWEARKQASKLLHKEYHEKQSQILSWDSLDDTGDRKSEQELEPPPAFTEPPPNAPDAPRYPTHFWDQITKDVDRSLWKQCPDETERNLNREKLHRMISAVLILVKDDEGKELHYFQGYHDIAAVCLLTCGEEVGYSVLKRLSTTYLRDQMQAKIDYVTSLLQALFPLVSTIDPKIGRVLAKSGVQPYAALPWVMTWFSHVLENEALSERMFDLFLASPTWMPLYLAASIIVFMGDNGLYSCPCEFSEVHNFVSRFCSKGSLPWPRLIEDSLKFYALFPPESVSPPLQSYLPEDSYLLRYPYPWVPANESLYSTSFFSSKTAIISATAGALVIGLGIGIAYMSTYSHAWGEQIP